MVLASSLLRSVWGANDYIAAKAFESPASQRFGLVVHHNGPPLGLDVGADPGALKAREMSLLRGIQRYHQITKGWSDIAYSFAVGQSGQIYTLRGEVLNQFANGSDQVGADDGTDKYWYTVLALLGGTEEPTEAMKDGIRTLVAHLRGIGAGTRVLPHNAFKLKACPGPQLTVFARELDEWIEETNSVTRIEYEAVLARLDILERNFADLAAYEERDARQGRRFKAWLTRVDNRGKRTRIIAEADPIHEHNWTITEETE